METHEAHRILTTLVNGEDPTGRGPLPAECVIHRTDVMRALIAAALSLKTNAARIERRAQLPARTGANWEAEEDAKLIASFKAGDKLEVLAARHQRSTSAVEARLVKLGLLTDEQRTSRVRFF